MYAPTGFISFSPPVSTEIVGHGLPTGFPLPTGPYKPPTTPKPKPKPSTSSSKLPVLLAIGGTVLLLLWLR